MSFCHAPRRIASLTMLIILGIVMGHLTICSHADELKRKGRPDTFKGKIKQVNPDGSVEFESPDLAFTMDKKDVEWARADRPPELAKAMTDAQTRKYAEAIKALKPIVMPLVGLPETGDAWVVGAAWQLGRCYLQLQDWAAAQDLFDKMNARYPKESVASKLADIGRAQIITGQQKAGVAIAIKIGSSPLKAAEDLLKPILAPAEKLLTVNPADSFLYANASLALGDAYAAAKQWKDALTSYLTVEVLYYHDKVLLQEARYKAAQMHETLNDWARAAELYQEILKPSSPAAVDLDDVKKRLASAEEKLKDKINP